MRSLVDSSVAKVSFLVVKMLLAPGSISELGAVIMRCCVH